MAAKKQARGIFGNLTNFVALMIMSFIFVMPLIFMISSAFKPLDEIFVIPPRFFVRNPTIKNFVDMVVLMSGSWVPFSRYIFNTLFVTAVASFAHIMIASMAAFVLAKYKFPGGKLFFNTAVLALMFAAQVTMIPNYLIMSKIGFIDTYAALIVPAIGLPLGLFLMKQFMEQIPDALLESAKVDGASKIRIFLQIAMPMVKPAWLTLMIISVQTMWNMDGRNFIFTEKLKMLPIALQQILQGGVARAGVGQVTGLFMLSVPLVIFLVNQSQMIETMASSGLKE